MATRRRCRSGRSYRWDIRAPFGDESAGIVGGEGGRRNRRDARAGQVGHYDPAQRGLGQHDSFDMKPEAPEAIRGEFKPIDSAVAGIHICIHSSMLAAQAKCMAIVRSMSHSEGNRLLAVHRVLTGQVSTPRGASDLDRLASRDDSPFSVLHGRPGLRQTASRCRSVWWKGR